MSSRLSSRVYNPTALEVWFENVGLDWEASFSKEALRRGREIYLKGQISGVELAEQDAIVHCKFARKDTCYAVIEWTKTGPNVRCSADDASLGDAVAVGGLYEIEELIADEISALAYEPKAAGEGEPEVAEAAEATQEVVDERPARRLTPRLEGVRSGLRLTAYWTNPDRSREAAFRSDATPLISAEREALVR